jgi:hypothetical protein
VFRQTEEACLDCGGDPFVATDFFPDKNDLVPVCFPCYIDRTDRVRACSVVEVRTEDRNAEFVVGGPSVAEAGEVARSIVEEVSCRGVDAAAALVSTLEEARDSIGDYHARELARAERSESRHVYAGTSQRGTVVDVETRADEPFRDALAETVARGILDRHDVRKRADAVDCVSTELPTLTEHRGTHTLGVEETVWTLAKDRGVSDASERSSENQKAGREFEEFFAGWCEDLNLEARRGKEALTRFYPEVADEVIRKTDGLAGVPDFLVRGDGQRLFGDGWRPEDDTFVEVKRGTSSLSHEQQRVLAHLKSHGFDVYVLRGEPNEYVFEKR